MYVNANRNIIKIEKHQVHLYIVTNCGKSMRGRYAFFAKIERERIINICF
jgi:hypothetical protein